MDMDPTKSNQSTKNNKVSWFQSGFQKKNHHSQGLEQIIA